MTYLEAICRWFFVRVRRSTSLGAEAQAHYRIVFGLYLLLVYLPTFQWIGLAPQVFFYPPTFSLSNLFGAFPGVWLTRLADGLLSVAAVCLTLGIRARWSTLVLAVILTLGLGFQSSFGKIDHNSLLPVTLWCFCLSNWGYRYALLPDRYRRADWLAPGLTAVFLSLAMLTAGYYKARGWIDFDLTTSGFANWYRSSLFSEYRLLNVNLLEKLPALLIEAMDYATVAFELSALLFLIGGRRSWRVWIGVACLFHLATTVFLTIHFLFHSIIYLQYLLPDRVSKPGKVTLRWVTTSVILLGGYHLLLRLSGWPASHLLLPVAYTPHALVYWLSVTVWMSLLIMAIRR